MAPKVAVVFYSLYGHIAQMAEAEKKGVEEAGGHADIYQIAETLPEDVLKQMGAPPKRDYPIATPQTLLEYDAYLFGIPTRFGNFPAQWKTFWDATVGLWVSGGYHGKKAGIFVSTASLGGGQESTGIAAMSTLVHHGITFVPLGYAKAMSQLCNVKEVHGGSPWGAGTLADSDGSRQPTEPELEVARIQGKTFYEHISQL
ncbi:flavodoxin-like fold protein [Onygenales sp. PD_40]|nr:flavodoxin-like fold protein [Onygenales sp. PD_40]KAK2782396.1 flavodoxin-like fold protein [Onygenales sp. PD_12]KAK2788569.1 flavodoxin-like fold protein [Emmonsiellopsis sp. PD_33]KAK2801681.1 flavodoxin-like fold protein [Onygenales sp. PD_10]